MSWRIWVVLQKCERFSGRGRSTNRHDRHRGDDGRLDTEVERHIHAPALIRRIDAVHL
jgi:hypothetical protein